MHSLLDEDRRRSRSRNRRQPSHKFSLGDHVICQIGVLSEKAPSEIVRLLPDGGAGLQYRIRSDRDGVERVVTESSIITADERDQRSCVPSHLPSSSSK